MKKVIFEEITVFSLKNEHFETKKNEDERSFPCHKKFFLSATEYPNCVCSKARELGFRLVCVSTLFELY